MKISLRSRLNKPEYLFRPTQLFRRLLHLRPGAGQSSEPTRVKLPWGHSVRVREQEVLGRALIHLGVYDLAASEVAWRLFPRGGCALDIGANLGYFSTLLAARGGAGSRIISFEPHPELFRQLSEHLAPWRSAVGPTIELHQTAVGERDEHGTLLIPLSAETNEGLARLSNAARPTELGDTRSVRVDVVRLDTLLHGTQIDFLKIDVEGAELNVFRGASDLLGEGKIPNILLEDHGGPESEVLKLLREAGFEVYRIRRSFWGPILTDPNRAEHSLEWEPPNYLATRNPAHAHELMAPRGWQVLSLRRPPGGA